MNTENTHSPNCILFSKQLNLSDFGFEKPALKKIKDLCSGCNFGEINLVKASLDISDKHKKSNRRKK